MAGRYGDGRPPGGSSALRRRPRSSGDASVPSLLLPPARPYLIFPPRAQATRGGLTSGVVAEDHVSPDMLRSLHIITTDISKAGTFDVSEASVRCRAKPARDVTASSLPGDARPPAGRWDAGESEARREDRTWPSHRPSD